MQNHFSSHHSSGPTIGKEFLGVFLLFSARTCLPLPSIRDRCETSGATLSLFLFVFDFGPPRASPPPAHVLSP